MIECALTPGATGSSAQRLHEGVAGGHVVEAGRQPRHAAQRQLVLVARHELGEPLRQVARRGDEIREQSRDAEAREIAAVVRRADEDHALHEGLGGEEHGHAQRLADGRIEVELLERDVGHVLPEAVAAVDRRQLGEEPALAVADHHHLAEGRVLALRVELRHGLLQRATQQPARVDDRIARVVEEEPDLVVIPQHAVVLDLVDQIRPAAGAGGRAVDEHQGDPPGPVREQEQQSLVLGFGRHRLLAGYGVLHRLAERTEGAGEETLQLEVPETRVRKGRRERRARLDLERDFAPFDGDEERLVGRVELDPHPELPFAQGTPGILDAKERGHGHAEAGNEALRRHGVLSGAGPEHCRERRADPGAPVAVAQTLDLEVGRGREGLEAVPRPDLLRRRNLDVDGADGYLVAPPGQCRAAGLPEGHRFGDPAVVEVVGEAHAGVGRVERLFVRSRKQQCVGVGRREEVVAAISGRSRRSRSSARRGRRAAAGHPGPRAPGGAPRAFPPDPRESACAGRAARGSEGSGPRAAPSSARWPSARAGPGAGRRARHARGPMRSRRRGRERAARGQRCAGAGACGPHCIPRPTRSQRARPVASSIADVEGRRWAPGPLRPRRPRAMPRRADSPRSAVGPAPRPRRRRR